jgi:DNA replication and repair protein RecF
MAAGLAIQSIALRHFRNIASADLTDLARFSVFSGNNGQGKTSVLEAAYLVCTTKSFRTAKLGEIVRHGEPVASVRAKIAEGHDAREQVIGLRGGTRTVTLGGKRPSSLASYAVLSPAVVFHPGEMVLSSGPASKRRTLLDRIALFVDPTSLDHLGRYAIALRSRQKLLETRGAEAKELEGFERIIASHGAAISRIRREACARIASELQTSFPRITAEQRVLEARYEPGGPEAESELQSALLAQRERDKHRGSASSGPHRDDLLLRLGGYDVRIDASQGEHRAVTLALKLAELACIASARGVHPVLLLDDVSSELDLARTALLFEFLRQTPGQILLTTTRPELIDTSGLDARERRDFHLREGVIGEGPSPSEKA